MAQYTPCPRCGEDVTPDSDFCPHCGILFLETGDVHCELHPGEKAVGVCILCRRTVCRRCSVQRSRRIHCVEHKDIEVVQDWALVFSSSDIADAELVKSVLENAGNKVMVQNFNSIGYVWDGGGDSPISRSNIHKPARVLVPNQTQTFVEVE